MTVNLTEVRIAGFQSFRSEQAISLDSGITLLAGRNNVGKSAVLRALRALVERQDGAHPDFALTLTWRMDVDDLMSRLFPPGTTGHDLEQHLRRVPTHTLTARFEARPRDDDSLDPGDLQCVLIELPELGWTATGTLGSNLGWGAGPYQGSATGSELFTTLATTLARQVTFIAPRRPSQGVQVVRPQAQLTPDAANLADVVFNLANNKRMTLLPRLEAFLSQAFPEITGFGIRLRPDDPTTAQGEIVIYTSDSTDGIPLRLCGSGIEQLLALSIGMMTATESRLFLVDEPQAYLHPHAERTLLSLMRAQPQHQFIVATHSNYLLSAVPISSVRLVTLGPEGTHVVGDASALAILGELGVKASDVWLSDAILWVEGPTEVAIVEWLVSEHFPDSALGLKVRAMPDASRFGSSGRKKTEADYRFCRAVAGAVTELPVAMHFLFDEDGRDDAAKGRIFEASSGTARFLPMNEIENFLLSPPAIHDVLSVLCAESELEPPTLAEVEATLAEALDGAEPDKAKGSHVLKQVFWKLAKSPYDKPRHGLTLAKAVMEKEPGMLDRLIAIVRECLPEGVTAGPRAMPSS